MARITKEEIISNLKYLGIKDGNFPDFLKENNPISFRTSRMQNDKNHKLFQYVPVDKIEVLLTPKRRNDTIQEKYSEAIPLSKFLDFENEDDENSATLINIISKLNVEEIEQIEQFQDSIMDEEPFEVKFNKDHLWQIYYSSETNNYFMLVCTKEDTFSEFFYLLKKKIEYANKKTNNVPKIYVPINYVNYSGSFLSYDEITDLENYIWYFTKEWPLIFEVYDKNNKLSFQVVGKTSVYENIKSSYKQKYYNKEDVIKFFKLVKALFIIQTEIDNYFKFDTKINDNNELEFSFQEKIIDYDSLHNFICDEFIYCVDAIENQIKESKKLNEDLSKLRLKAQKKEEEYLLYQNQISTYLDYKKTFFGKVKYFFKGTKVSKKKGQNTKEEKKLDLKNKIELFTTDTLDIQKDYYTIEELVIIYSNREKNNRIIDDLNNDTKAITIKLESLTKKAKNAKSYIDEIDKHRKSIFDFWKYTNKDEKLKLDEGKSSEQANSPAKKVKKIFNLENDFQEYMHDMDLIQRQTLSQDELDALFVANSDLLELINLTKINKVKKEFLQSSLDRLIEQFEKDRLIISKETFDIFGNIKNDNTKIQYIGSKSHRENQKDILKIMSINKNSEVSAFKNKLLDIVSLIDSANQKIKSKAEMTLYKVVPNDAEIAIDGYDIYNIDVEDELRNYNIDNESNLKIIKLNFKTDYPINYYTNIAIFDNFNKTLPLGMDLSTKALIDANKFDFSLINEINFKTNNYLNNIKDIISPKVYTINLLEYDVHLKDDNENIEIAKTINTKKSKSNKNN